MAGINLSFLADVRDFLRGSSQAQEALENVGHALDDVAANSEAAQQQMSADFTQIARDANDASDKVGDSIGDIGEKGKPRAAEAGSEIGSELAQNIGEQIGSGQANIADVVAGTLGGLVSVPGLGAAAAGIGIAGLLVKGVIDGFSRAKQEMAARIQATFDAMDVDPTGAINLDKLQVVDNAIEKHFDSVTEGWKKISETGLDPTVVQQALTGGLDATDLATLDAALAAHTTNIKDASGTIRQQYDEEGKTLLWLKQQNEDQTQANRDATIAKQEQARVTQGLTSDTADATGATEDNTRATADNTAKLRANAQERLDARGKARDYQQALDDATEALKENGRTLDIHTQKGRDNQAALDAIAQAAEADGKVRRQEIQDFKDAAEAMGLKADQAKRLARELGLIPKQINTTVKLDINSEETQRQLQRIGFRWDQP